MLLKYGEVLVKIQKKLQEASNTVEAAATRTRAIERKLRGVEELTVGEAKKVLMLEEPDVDLAVEEPGG